ncbi:hypothetical protein [Streptococcus minor]|uniref:hypothetical protein n=1 Tax=Streptococcus minor TaxID=229549 RepID=UPI00039A2BCF|nr:hypothetical protein [Streptococcus minor]
MQLYYGDIPLCYTHSAAMVLHAYGYDFQPPYLEALMAMGNGANFLNDDPRHPLVFFDNGEPDISISNCLQMLGFEYDEYYLRPSDEMDVVNIKENLASLLKNGPVIVGPLDMGHLTYNPNHGYLKGVDHFVTIYDLIGDELCLHDPAGYPCMQMNFTDFLPAWQAESIAYKRGSFSMWGNLRRVEAPSPAEIYHKLSLTMKKRYESSQSNVIQAYADSIRSHGLNSQQKQLHDFFSFRLASARSNYLSHFLRKHDLERAVLKEKMADLFGQAHLASLREDFISLADILQDIAQLDNQFKEKCLQYKGRE